ncbi:cell division topological specificity factor MinE [Haliovirga abyssi]|uniref:Cell division topological specificity factor n=1 Tax=Haliovirga abyssi TaxID=2996794 RepID=A0AAU9DBC6_9FUSO|nr:cell division topological specificity factor MinE [Haliovirga abyssi]BDU50766.1 cell division topological specificity factor [Haliovirga abyssi]
MFEAIKKLFVKEKSGEIAKNRLRVVIMQDRTTFTPVLMENLKRDLIGVFSKYLEIDTEGLEFNLEKEDDNVGLSINIPIKKVKSDTDSIDEK